MTTYSDTAHAWHVWPESATTETLMGAHLNSNLWYLSSMLSKGITGGNIATGGIDAGTLIAADIVGEAHIDYTKASGARLLQIGKNTSTVTGQMLLKGTALITANTETNTDITIYYTGGDCAVTADGTFSSVPMVWATVYTADHPTITIKACATNSCLINVDCYDTNTFTENWTVYWCAIGNK